MPALAGLGAEALAVIWAPTFADFESRSRADLKKVGGRVYWDDPSSEVLCCVLHHPEWGRIRWTPGDGPLFRPDDPPLEAVAAHNWRGFDRFAWARLGWPWPKREVDTSEIARRAGLAGKLEKLAEIVGHDVKDKEGSRLTVGLSAVRQPNVKDQYTPAQWKALGKDGQAQARAVWSQWWASLSKTQKRQTGVQKAAPDPATLRRVVEYCDRDVTALVDAWPMLAPFLDAEPEVEWADRICNDRGVAFDLELARALLDVDARMAREACESVGVSMSALNSNVQFPALVRALGVDCPNAKFETVEDLTRHPNTRVADLAEARLAVASIARGKLEAGLSRTQADGIMRDNMRYVAAHTWRWGGVGFQVQNIPWIDKRA